MKIRFTLLVLLVFCITLSSCQLANLNDTDTSVNAELTVNELDENATDEITTLSSSVEEETETLHFEPPSDNIANYRFESYDELLASFSTEAPKDDPVQSEKSMYGENYEAFVDKMTSSDTKIIIPYYNGSPMKLYRPKDFGITLMSYDFVELPWIWYFCEYEEELLRIKITYPLVDIPQDYSASDALKAIYPEAVNVHNYQDFENYDSVYTQTITMDGMELDALIYDLNKIERITKCIYYKGFFIMVYIDEQLNDENLWENLSFE